MAFKITVHSLPQYCARSVLGTGLPLLGSVRVDREQLERGFVWDASVLCRDHTFPHALITLVAFLRG